MAHNHPSIPIPVFLHDHHVLRRRQNPVSMRRCAGGPVLLVRLGRSVVVDHHLDWHHCLSRRGRRVERHGMQIQGLERRQMRVRAYYALRWSPRAQALVRLGAKVRTREARSGGHGARDAGPRLDNPGDHLVRWRLRHFDI